MSDLNFENVEEENDVNPIDEPNLPLELPEEPQEEPFPAVSEENVKLNFYWTINDFSVTNKPLSGTIKDVSLCVTYGPVWTNTSVTIFDPNSEEEVEPWSNFIPLENIKKSNILGWIDSIKGPEFRQSIEKDLINSYNFQMNRFDSQKYISSINRD
jgi:hypothetical protein